MLNVTAGADCADFHTGFRCATCVEGAVKIKGKCTECTGLSIAVLLTDLVFKFATALFLFHKSTKAYFGHEDVKLMCVLSNVLSSFVYGLLLRVLRLNTALC